MRENLAVLQFGIFQWLKRIDGFCKAHAPNREEGMPSSTLRTASNNTATEVGAAISAWTWLHCQRARTLWSRRSGLNGRPAVYEFQIALPQTT